MTIKEIMNGCTIEKIFPIGYTKGGQWAGSVICGCKISHPSFDVVIEIREGRSYHKNYIVALTLFELAITDLLNL